MNTDSNFVYPLIAVVVGTFTVVKLITSISFGIWYFVHRSNTVQSHYFDKQSSLVITTILFAVLFSGEVHESLLMGNLLSCFLRVIYRLVLSFVFYHYWKIVYNSGCKTPSKYISRRFNDPVISFIFKVCIILSYIAYYVLMYERLIYNSKVNKPGLMTFDGIMVFTVISLTAALAFTFGGIGAVELLCVLDFVLSFSSLPQSLFVLHYHKFQILAHKFEYSSLYQTFDVQTEIEAFLRIAYSGLLMDTGYDLFSRAEAQKKAKLCLIVSVFIHIIWILTLGFIGFVAYQHFKWHFKICIDSTYFSTLWYISNRSCGIMKSLVVPFLSLHVISILAGFGKEFGLIAINLANFARSELMPNRILKTLKEEINIYMGYWCTTLAAATTIISFTIFFYTLNVTNGGMVRYIFDAILIVGLQIILYAPLYNKLSVRSLLIGISFSILSSAILFTYAMSTFSKNVKYTVSRTVVLYSDDFRSFECENFQKERLLNIHEDVYLPEDAYSETFNDKIEFAYFNSLLSLVVGGIVILFSCIFFDMNDADHKNTESSLCFWQLKSKKKSSEDVHKEIPLTPIGLLTD